MMAVATAVGDVVGPNADTDTIDEMLQMYGYTALCFMSLMQSWRMMDHILYDIPPEEEAMPKVYSERKHLEIDDLSDVQAHKMTHFYHGQLRRLYDLFDLEGYMASIGEYEIPLYTGNYTGNTPCRYLVPPEELVLFMLTKIATGRTNQSIIDEWFGGDYNRWSYGYRWMLRYLDDRYANIIGHQGLTRFLKDFPRFNRAIERYVQKDRRRENLDGSYSIIPGLEFLPWDVFGFLDDSIDRICAPFSGPRGDYQGAARKEEYDEAQRAVYTGYKKCHGIKVETVFLPNGITTVFGPVSARRGDAGVLQMSNLNAFLSWLQFGMFLIDGNEWILFSLFGDGAFSIGLQCVQSYYRAFGAGAQLTDEQKKCNFLMKGARITIEKNYGMTSTIFRICDSAEGLKIAKKNPYAIEQLRVCHLLVNCYICLNGDQASSDNTFGVNPPKLEDYLAL